VVKTELLTALKHPTVPVDILVVVHNQLDYLKRCHESVRCNTPVCRILYYNNGSDEETGRFIASHGDYWFDSPDNEGFIVPNNRLAGHAFHPYIILLNTDTVVLNPFWVRAMTSWLREHPDVGVVGYEGGLLDENGRGCGSGHGRDIDYVQGWCLCISRQTYQKYGLFDQDNLKFAYGEDADLCLRLREAGLSPYALHLDAVLHYGNRTVLEVAKERGAGRMEETFRANHEYIKTRWRNYIRDDRILARSRFTVAGAAR
jgi:GT2 family glycosyltransferase